MLVMHLGTPSEVDVELRGSAVERTVSVAEAAAAASANRSDSPVCNVVKTRTPHWKAASASFDSTEFSRWDIADFVMSSSAASSPTLVARGVS